MSAKEQLYQIANESNSYDIYLINVKKRFGSYVDLIRIELIDSIYNKVKNNIVLNKIDYTKL